MAFLLAGASKVLFLKGHAQLRYPVRTVHGRPNHPPLSSPIPATRLT